MNEFDEIEELSRGKRLACNLSAAFIVLIAGLFLLLCGVGVFDISVSQALAGTVLWALWLLFTVSALISRNSVTLWIGFCFFGPAVVEPVVKLTTLGYANLYPVYIAIPAIASLFTMLFTRAWFAHLPVILLFGVAAAIFALGNIDGVGWAVIIPTLVIYLGCLMLVLALKSRKKDDEDEY